MSLHGSLSPDESVNGYTVNGYTVARQQSNGTDYRLPTTRYPTAFLDRSNVKQKRSTTAAR